MAAYTGTQPTFLSDVFTTVNNALNTFVTTFSTNISSEIAPIVMSGLILSFMIVGIMAIRGMLNSPFQEVAWKMAFVSVITSIALTAGVYQKYVLDIFLTMPDDLISSIVAKSVNGVQTGGGAAQAIEQLYALGVYNAGLYIDQAGVSLTDGFNLSPYLYAALVFVGTVMCCFVGTLWLFIAKIVLALMLGVGPIFIVSLCWKPTEQFFYKWLGVILNTIISAVFVVAIFTIFATFFKQNLEMMEVTEDSANFLNAGIFFFVGLLCMGVLTQVPNYVSQLTGGAVGAVGSAMANMTSKIGGGAGNVASGVAGGAKAYGSTQQAKASYQNAREQGASKATALNQARQSFNRGMSKHGGHYPELFRKNASNTQS